MAFPCCSPHANRQPRSLAHPPSPGCPILQALEKAWKEASLPSDREHVTYYIWKNSDLLNGKKFTSLNITAENNQNLSHIRLTLDYPVDKELLEKLIEIDGIEKSWNDYVKTLLKNPSLLEINKSVNSNL